MLAVRFGRVGGVLAVGSALLMAVACSSSEETPEPAAAGSGGDGAAATDAGGAAAEPGSPSIPADVPPLVMLDGEDVGPGFDEQQCARRGDDGGTRLEYTATRGDDQSALAVGIVLSDPPRLDALSFDSGPDTWEAAEADLDQSVVLVDGNAYRVHSPVSDAEGARTSDVGVLFGCSG